MISQILTVNDKDTRASDWSWADHNSRMQYKRSNRYKELLRRLHEKPSFLYADEYPAKEKGAGSGTGAGGSSGGSDDDTDVGEQDHEYDDDYDYGGGHGGGHVSEFEIRRRVEQFLDVQVRVCCYCFSVVNFSLLFN